MCQQRRVAAKTKPLVTGAGSSSAAETKPPRGAADTTEGQPTGTNPKRGVTFKLKDIEKFPPRGVFKDGKVTVIKHDEYPMAPDAGLVLEPGKIPRGYKPPKKGKVMKRRLRMRIWGTLRCHPVTHQSASVLTERGSRDLATQVRFSTFYKDAVKAAGQSVPAGRVINPAKVEQMMGLPTNWTSTSAPVTIPPYLLPKPSDHRLEAVCFFAGCGGLTLGTEFVFKNVAYVEKYPAAIKMLESRMKDGHISKAPIYYDVEMFDVTKYKKKWHKGGFPCQGIAIPGKKRGLQDPRTRLVASLLKHNEDGEARGCLLENVDGIRAVEMKPVMEFILNHYQRTGFTVRMISLMGRHAGARQCRRRWFALAYRDVTDLQELSAAVGPLDIAEWREAVKAPFNPQAEIGTLDWLMPEYKEDTKERLHVGCT